MKLYAGPLGQDQLLEVDFCPTTEVDDKGVTDQEGIARVLGRANRVILGIPQVTDVLAEWPSDEPLSNEIAALSDDWDFLNVRLALSFVPDRRCRFVWARMGLELKLDGDVSPQSNLPIAFDLYPREVSREVKVKRTFEIEPSLKFAFAEISTKLGNESESVHYVPQIIAAGLLSSTPTWTFKTGDSGGISGSREIFMVVKKPKNAEVLSRFKIGAELHGHLGPIPVKTYGDDSLINRQYELKPQ